MSHIKKFLSYRDNKKATNVVKESVLQVDDNYKVRVIVDVKKSMVNSYIKKVSDNTQKNLRDFYSDMDIVEELVKHVVESGMNVDTIPATLLVGGSQTKAQGQPQAQSQPIAQTQPQAEPQASDFEEVQTPQEEPAQEIAQPQGQGQSAQVQTEPIEEAPKEETEEEEGEELPR